MLWVSLAVVHAILHNEMDCITDLVPTFEYICKRIGIVLHAPTSIHHIHTHTYTFTHACIHPQLCVCSGYLG